MKSLFALAIHRAEFLSADEKTVVADMVSSEGFFRTLTVDMLSQVVGRVLRSTAWDPVVALRLAESDLRFVERHSVSVIDRFDPDYPPMLAEIHDPPYLLFVRGSMPDSGTPSVAIVGTRKPSEQALIATNELAEGCAAAGLTVVSGLARGIDAAAHLGALRRRGITVAVLGNGIDTVYPSSHRTLAYRILEQGGAIVSEYPPGTPPIRYHFPARNRIISGICRSVVVAEAPAQSGALHTSEFALEQGRDLFVLAAGTHGEAGAGCRALARDGAAVIDDVRDILVDWGSAGARSAEQAPAGSGARYRGSGAAVGRQLALELEREIGV
ncbi:MAG: DNA-protecting protein DprA [Spirochaetaceae bacterium]|nr:MAG: DNA-protecting protein DprA [Spirochaetaceae bacterium]